MQLCAVCTVQPPDTERYRIRPASQPAVGDVHVAKEQAVGASVLILRGFRN